MIRHQSRMAVRIGKRCLRVLIQMRKMKKLPPDEVNAIIEAVWSGETTMRWNWQSKKEASNIRLQQILQEIIEQ